MRFGWRARICMAPAPHVDGDPFWGLVRSRRGGLCRAPRKDLPEVSGHHDGAIRRSISAATVASLGPWDDRMLIERGAGGAAKSAGTHLHARRVAMLPAVGGSSEDRGYRAAGLAGRVRRLGDPGRLEADDGGGQ